MNKKLVGSLAGIAVLFAVNAPSRVASAAGDDHDDDFAVRLLHHVETMKGGPGNSPLEEKLRAKLEAMDAPEDGDAGGFEPPPDVPAATAPTNDDEQFAALQDIMQKQTALERVKTGIWFLVIMPGTRHRDEVQHLIDTNAQALGTKEQSEYQDYMSVRKSLAGSSTSTRIKRWSGYAKSKPQSSFSDLANREASHLKTIEKDKSTATKNKVFNTFVKIGIVVLLLAIIAGVAFGLK